MNNWIKMENVGDAFPYEMLKINGADSHYIIVEECFYGSHVRYVVDNVVKYNKYLAGKLADLAKEHILLVIEEMTPEDSEYYEAVKQIVKDELEEDEDANEEPEA